MDTMKSPPLAKRRENSWNYGKQHEIRPEGTPCDNWFYYTDIISISRTLVTDYYHPANYYTTLHNYYTVTNIFQQVLLYEKKGEC